MNEYILLLNCTIPIFSGVGCAFLILLSYNDNLTRSEAEIKRVTILYLLTAAYGWLMIFFYNYFPAVFLPFNILGYLAVLYVQIFLYKIFFIFTKTSESEHFSHWHYVAPVAIWTIRFICILFVPYDIQLEIVAGKGANIPEGYEVFTRIFISSPPVRTVLAFIYITLTFIRLRNYYRRINRSSSLVRRPARWVIFLGILVISSIVCTIIGTFIPHIDIYTSLVLMIPAIIIFAQHILLTYHIVMRDYLLYIEPHKNEYEKPALKPRKAYTRMAENPLTKSRFEAWFNKNKPYLNPTYKITEMAEELNINRTYLSGFINKTYGVNFNRYINRCRLEELNRLTKFSGGKEKDLRKLVDKAGFYDYKHYKRALLAEQEDLVKDMESNKKAGHR